MKIYLADYDSQAIGGGFGFARKFSAIMEPHLSDYDSAHIYFIPSASMVAREAVLQARADGKRIVLRVDNIIRNSRNRNTGMSRMKDFADMADLVIFQSEFAENLLNPFLQTENWRVILNGVDAGLFNTRARQKTDGNQYIYSKYSSDETKNFEMARLSFSAIAQQNSEAYLHLVGRFDAAVEQYNFDFYNGERYNYYGIVDEVEMAHILKGCDHLIYTYFNDACSNTLIEALRCGLDVCDPYGMSKTGGAGEILQKFINYGAGYFILARVAQEYYEAMVRL